MGMGSRFSARCQVRLGIRIRGFRRSRVLLIRACRLAVGAVAVWVLVFRIRVSLCLLGLRIRAFLRAVGAVGAWVQGSRIRVCLCLLGPLTRACLLVVLVAAVGLPVVEAGRRSLLLGW